MNNELVEVLSLTAREEQLTRLSVILKKYEDTAAFTAASAKVIIQLLQQQGLSVVEAIEQCMYLCELIASLEMNQGLYLMIQLYVDSMNEYMHHVWDAIELYLFENPRQSSVDYLNYLLSSEQDQSTRKLYQDWIDGLTQELQHNVV